MESNFAKLQQRTINACRETDFEVMKNFLKKIKNGIFCVGVGGSEVVADFAATIFPETNACGAISGTLSQAFDMKKYHGLFERLLLCSYSGSNPAIDRITDNGFANFRHIYLLTSNRVEIKTHVDRLRYVDDNIEREKSFISLATTLMPMALLLRYYLEKKNLGTYHEVLSDMFANIKDIDVAANNKFEVFSYGDTRSSAKFLQSTMHEAGLGICAIHDKYGYCHGLSTLAYHNKQEHTLIHLINKKIEIDDVLSKNEIYENYKQVIVVDGPYEDAILNEFFLTLQCMYLCKNLAIANKKDLSRVDYAPSVKFLYRYKGEM